MAVGHLRINSLFDLRPTTGVSSDFTCFVLDETPGVHTGEVLLCINNGERRLLPVYVHVPANATCGNRW